jgi:hypothetical protein
MVSLTRLFIIPLSIILLFAGPVQALDPLPVIYGEDESDEIVESQQSYIDNQAYLREFEQKRTARVLSTPREAPVAVIKRKSRARSFTPFNFPFYRDYQSSDFLSVEVQGNGTTVRYVDGYQPNCCGPYYYAPPRPTPYHSGRPGRPRR